MADNGSLMIAEATRIVSGAQERNLHLRLLGAIAFQIHCPKYSPLAAKLGRMISDIDFAAYSKERTQVDKMMREFGYTDDRMVTALFSSRRMIWNNNSNGMHADIFFDKLEMNHDLRFGGRLETDGLTIPLADMLLEKMQIVHFNEKDMVDTIMLLREHSVGKPDPETIDGSYIAKLLSKDWGFYHTATANLENVQNRLQSYDELSEEDRVDISGRIQTLLGMTKTEPKTISWKSRAMIGTKSKWYRDVQDVRR